MIEKTIAIVFKVLWLLFCMVFIVVFTSIYAFIKSVMIHTCYFDDAATMLCETLIYVVSIAKKY
jgi:hypothetical protein